MNRFLYGALLAGVSGVALLAHGGMAWAAAGEGLTFNTSTSNGGALANANTGTSYSSGVLTINGSQTGTASQSGLYIWGTGSAVSALTVDVNAAITGGTTTGAGILLEATGVTQNLTINQNGSVTNAHANSGGIVVYNGSTLNSLTNYGTISGANFSNSNAIGVDASGRIGTITNYGTITGASSANPTFSITTTGTVGAIINRSGGVISNTAGAAAIELSTTTESTITNYGTITGDIDLGTTSSGDHVVYLEAGSSLTGGVQPQSANNGNVVVGTAGAGVVLLNGDLGRSGVYLHRVVLANGATLALGQDTTIAAGSLGISGGATLDLGSNKLTFLHYDTSHSDGADSGMLYYKTTINTNTGKHGYVVLTKPDGTSETTYMNGGSAAIVPTVVGTSALGSKYIVIQDTNGRVAGTLPSVTNSGGYRWTVSQVTGTGQTDTDGVSYGTGYTNIVLTNGGSNAAGTATGANGAGVKALAAYSGSDSGLLALSNAVNNLSSDADIKRAGAQLRPETTGNTAQASMGAVTQALSTIQVRTDAVRVAASETGTGVSSGETLKGLGVWGQAFGTMAKQGERNDVSGYDSATYGLAFGADAKVIDPLRVGLSFAYANTDVNSTGDRSGSGQDIDSYITSLYGTFAATGWYVDGALTYGLHKYNATRAVNIAGAAAQTLTADYSGQQWGAKTELGLPLAIGPTVFTPLASLAYNHLAQNEYRETGGSAALTVAASATDSVRSGLGAKIAAKVATMGNWEISPNARALWLHEFNKSTQDQTSAYVAGGSSFTTTGTDIATEHFNIGLGLDVASLRNTTLSAKYDADLADKYVSHTGSLQIRTEF